MTSIGAFQAKTHLSQLLDKVSRGERIEILRHGKPVARLVPADEEDRSAQSHEAARRMATRSKNILLGKGITLKELKMEGRR